MSFRSELTAGDEVKIAGLASKITATVIVGVLWFAFIVLYLAFYAAGLSFWQKTAVFLASAAIVGGIIAAFWIRWTLEADHEK